MEGNIEIDRKDGLVIVSVNPKIYPLDIVLSAAYVFTERCYVLVDGDPTEEIVVELRPKKKESVEKLGREFNNELIEYATYAVQSLKNERIREMIMQRVFEPRHTNVPSPEPIAQDIGEDKPWYDDPEQIAVPWEEKYGKDTD